jgi:hypothetical protein
MQLDTKIRAGEVEISHAAIAALRRIRAAFAGRVDTHGARDGGLICELRNGRSRPMILRVAADGAVLPDSPYSFRLRAFVPAGLPSGVA